LATLAAFLVGSTGGTGSGGSSLTGALTGSGCGSVLAVAGGSGFGREALIVWCTDNDVDCLFSRTRNRRLLDQMQAELAEAANASAVSDALQLEPSPAGLRQGRP